MQRVSRKLEWEIIIVDDASPDGTQDVAKQLASLYGEDRIVSRRTVHLGVKLIHTFRDTDSYYALGRAS